MKKKLVFLGKNLKLSFRVKPFIYQWFYLVIFSVFFHFLFLITPIFAQHISQSVLSLPVGSVVKILDHKLVKLGERGPFMSLSPFYEASGTFQDFTQEMCAAWPEVTGLDYSNAFGKYSQNANLRPFLLKDTRDGKTYEIRRFADGHCWMVDNLAYGGGTDGVADYCLNTTQSSWRSADSAANTIAIATNGLNPPDGSRNTLVGNCINYNQIDYCQNGANGKCGYIYNWAAAIQNAQGWGTTTQYNDFQPSEPTTGICPVGWYLPSSNQLCDLDKKIYNKGDCVSYNLANNFYQTQSGGFKLLFSSSLGSYGALWSSTKHSTHPGRYIYNFVSFFNLSKISPQNLGVADDQYNVRCLKIVPPAPSIPSMQDFTSADCTSWPTVTGTDYSNANGKFSENASLAPVLLKDTRDGKTYEIRKFSDGNCWMVDNLAYGGGTDGSADYCVTRTTLANWRNATSQELASAVATNGLNPTDGSRNTLFGECVNSISTSAYCQGLNGKCGYIYNWPAAIQSDLGYSGSSYNPTQPVTGICPAGWYLPSRVHICNLEKAANNKTSCSSYTPTSDNFFLPGHNFKGVYAGTVSSTGGSSSEMGVKGYYFSSTGGSTASTVNLRIAADKIEPELWYAKSAGFSVRCLKTP